MKLIHYLNVAHASLHPRRTAIAFIPALILLLPLALAAQDYQQTIERTSRFAESGRADNELHVYNIHGNITIEGYNGEEVHITARQVISGSSSEIERGRKELQLEVEQRNGDVFVYLDAPFITIRRDNDSGAINYHVDRDAGSYQFRHDITVRVPREVNIRASTINDGSVVVRNTRRRVRAFNVNGDIKLTGMAGATAAHTVNGDINLRYDRSPRQDSDFQTVNGTIEAYFPAGLSADIRFKSLNGDLYTDFENIQHLQARTKREEKDGRGATRFRVDRFAPVRIGAGGPTFHFKVLSGDVYIRKIQS